MTPAHFAPLAWLVLSGRGRSAVDLLITPRKQVTKLSAQKKRKKKPSNVRSKCLHSLTEGHPHTDLRDGRDKPRGGVREMVGVRKGIKVRDGVRIIRKGEDQTQFKAWRGKTQK